MTSRVSSQSPGGSAAVRCVPATEKQRAYIADLGGNPDADISLADADSYIKALLRRQRRLFYRGQHKPMRPRYQVEAESS